MDFFTTFSFILSISLAGICYRLDKRVKALEEPVRQKKADDLMIARAKVKEVLNNKEK